MKPLTIILGALGIGALGYYAYKNYQPGQKAAASFGPLPPLPEPVLLPAKVDKPTVITSTVSSAAPATKVTATVLEQILKPSTAPAPLPALTSVKLVNETVTVPGTNEQIVVPTIKPVYTQPAPQPAPAPVYVAPVYVKPTPVVKSYSEPVYYNAPIEQQPSYEQRKQTYLQGCLI